MKNAIVLVLAAVTVFLAGCSTSKVAYTETQKPNALFHYRNPNYSYLIEPQALDNGYAREITAANLGASLEELHVTNREFAVVSIFWDVSVPETEQIINKWTQLLRQHHFDRIVFIRENGVREETTLIHDNHRANNPPITAGAEPWTPIRASNVFPMGGS